MSTGPCAEAACVRENQSKVDRGDSNPALFYLFQEVSKLASPVHSSFLDTNPADKSLEASQTNPFSNKNEEEGDGHSFQVSFTSFQRSLSSKMPQNAAKHHVSEEGLDGASSNLEETAVERNTPWKVLSLINLHCEKLLHQGDDEASCSTPASLTSSAAAAAEGRVQLAFRSSPLCGRRDVPASTSEVICCGKDAECSCSLQPQTAEKTDSVRVELQENDATAALDPQHGYRQDEGFRARRVDQNRELSNHGSTESYILEEVLCEKAAEQTCISKTCRSNDESEDPSKPAVTLDHNANVILNTELPHDAEPLDPSAILLSLGSVSFIFNADALSKQDDAFSTPAALEGKSPAASPLRSSSHDPSSASSGPEVRLGKREATGLSSTCQRGTKTPRKQPHPSRSADIQDPNFQGVTFRMATELDDTREQCRLLVTSKYSMEPCRSVRRPRRRNRTLQKSIKMSSSDEDNDPVNNPKGKICASCCTSKTPMWRDAEDGTPLCNACGIRYKKYRVRCVNCWHIPRKEGNSNSRCLKCGNSARLASAQRKHST